MGHSQHVSASSITLLLTKEVEEILYGNEEKYKGREIASKDLNDSNAQGFKTPKVAKPTTFQMPVANTSHMDAVPQATPVNRNRVVYKKVRTFPLCFDDQDPATVHEHAQAAEVLVPIRWEIREIWLNMNFSWN